MINNNYSVTRNPYLGGSTANVPTSKTQKSDFSKLLEPNTGQTAHDSLIASYSLTDDQIKDLKSRYDVESLSKDDLKKLLNELTELGAITKDDNHTLALNGRPMIVGAFQGGARSIYEEFESGDILDWLAKSASEYTDLLTWMDENTGYLDSKFSLEKAANVSGINGYKEQLERMSLLLSKLK